MNYLSGLPELALAIGAVALAIVAWRLLRAPKKPADAPLVVEDYVDRIEKYASSAEPKRPLKTVEVREAKDGIPF